MRVGREREIVMDSYCFYHILLYIIIILKGKRDNKNFFYAFHFGTQNLMIYIYIIYE